MPGYDPRFWELPFDPGDLDLLPGGLLDAPEGCEPDPARVAPRNEALAVIGELVRTGLTAKQRRIVELYFYEARTQVEIAAERLSGEMIEVLRDFVRNGTKQEAVFATRRLDGFRVAHEGELTPEQRATAERAHGRVWRWVRVSDG